MKLYYSTFLIYTCYSDNSRFLVVTINSTDVISLYTTSICRIDHPRALVKKIYY